MAFTRRRITVLFSLLMVLLGWVAGEMVVIKNNTLEARYPEMIAMLKQTVIAAAAKPSQCISPNTLILVIGSHAHADNIKLQSLNVAHLPCFRDRYVLILYDDKGYRNLCQEYWSNGTAERTIAGCFRSPEEKSLDGKGDYHHFIWRKHDYVLVLLKAGINVWLYDGDVVFLRPPFLDTINQDLAYQGSFSGGVNDGQVGFKASNMTIALVEELIKYHLEHPKDKVLTQDILEHLSRNSANTAWAGIKRRKMNDVLVSSNLFINKNKAHLDKLVSFHCNFLNSSTPVAKLRKAVDILHIFNKTLAEGHKSPPIPEYILAAVNNTFVN